MELYKDAACSSLRFALDKFNEALKNGSKEQINFWTHKITDLCNVLDDIERKEQGAL